MNKLFYGCLAGCAIMLMSCQQQVYCLNGKADNEHVEGRMVTLKLPLAGGEWESLDSCEVTHGLFALRGTVDTVTMTTLFVDDMPVMPVILEPGKMDVDISNLELRVSGTPLNDKLYAFIDSKNKLDSRLMELGHTESQMIMNGVPYEEVQQYVDSTYNALNNELIDLVSDFISSNYTNVLGECGFNMISNGMPQPDMTPLIRRVLDGAPQSFKQLPVVNDFIKAAQENSRYSNNY